MPHHFRGPRVALAGGLAALASPLPVPISELAHDVPGARIVLPRSVRGGGDGRIRSADLWAGLRSHSPCDENCPRAAFSDAKIAVSSVAADRRGLAHARRLPPPVEDGEGPF